MLPSTETAEPRCACGRPLGTYAIGKGLTQCIRCALADAALPKTGSIMESVHEDAKWERE